MIDYVRLIDNIRQCASNVRHDFASGYLESVYQNALMVQFYEAGIFAEKEVPIQLLYHNRVIGDFRADILVERKIILELKAVSELKSIHEVQLVNYLQVTNLDVGVLINYGAEKFGFIPKFRTYELLELYRNSIRKSDSRW